MFLVQLHPSHLGQPLDLPGDRLGEFAERQSADSTGQWEEVVMDKVAGSQRALPLTNP